MQSGIDRSLLEFVVLLDVGSINVHGSIFVQTGYAQKIIFSGIALPVKYPSTYLLIGQQ